MFKYALSVISVIVKLAGVVSISAVGLFSWNYAKSLMNMPKDPMLSFIKLLRIHGTTVLYCDATTRPFMPITIQPQKIDVQTLPSSTMALFAAAALHDVTGIIGVAMVERNTFTLDSCMDYFKQYCKPLIVLLVSPTHPCSAQSFINDMTHAYMTAKSTKQPVVVPISSLLLNINEAYYTAGFYIKKTALALTKHDTVVVPSTYQSLQHYLYCINNNTINKTRCTDVFIENTDNLTSWQPSKLLYRMYLGKQYHHTDPPLPCKVNHSNTIFKWKSSTIAIMLQALQISKRPVIIIGDGVIEPRDTIILANILEYFSIPVYLTSTVRTIRCLCIIDTLDVLMTPSMPDLILQFGANATIPIKLTHIKTIACTAPNYDTLKAIYRKYTPSGHHKKWFQSLQRPRRPTFYSTYIQSINVYKLPVISDGSVSDTASLAPTAIFHMWCSIDNALMGYSYGITQGLHIERGHKTLKDNPYNAIVLNTKSNHDIVVNSKLNRENAIMLVVLAHKETKYEQILPMVQNKQFLINFEHLDSVIANPLTFLFKH